MPSCRRLPQCGTHPPLGAANYPRIHDSRKRNAWMCSSGAKIVPK